MSLNITDTTYSGSARSEFIVRAMFGAETVMKGIVFVKDGIKKKLTIPRFSVTNVVQARAATPVSQGSINVDGRPLEPKDYMIYIEFNPRDFEDHWFAEYLDPKLLDRALPATVESALLQELLKNHDKFHEVNMWQGVEGSATPYTYYDGFIEKLANDGNTVLVANPVALTTGNIISKLEEVKAAIPKDIKKDPNLKYLVSVEDEEKYSAALRALGIDSINVSKGAPNTFDGKPVVALPGLPENTIIVTRCSADMNSNLWVGLNSKDDEAEVKLAPLQANSELWFVKMLFKADVQIGWTEEVVMYRYVAP